MHLILVLISKALWSHTDNDIMCAEFAVMGGGREDTNSMCIMWSAVCADHTNVKAVWSEHFGLGVSGTRLCLFFPLDLFWVEAFGEMERD